MKRMASIVGLLVSLLPALACAGDWPQFRGPNCTGVSNSQQPLPTRFSPTENVQWKAELGDGIAGAVVADGRVFVSSMAGDERVALTALDLQSGKQLWQRVWETGPLADIHATNSQASSTPATDGKRVFFYFSTLGMMAVDATTGADLWTHKLPTPFFVFRWGPGMSPVLHGDKVLFCQDDDLSPAFYAFDQATGKVLWKDDRLDMAVNYSHPVVCQVDGRDEIVVAGTGRLIGYDPDTGRRLWYAKVLLRNIKTTPVSRDGVVYISLQSSAIANQWLASVDRDEKAGNRDNRLDKAEIQAFVGKQPIPPAFFERTFDRGDRNRDGFLAGEELDFAFLHPDNFAGANFQASGEAAAEQFVLAVRGGGKGDVTQTHLQWKHKTRNTDHIVSPLIREDRMLLVKEGGITTVFNTKDGQSIRGPKRVGNGGGYFASPVAGDGKIFLASENGKVIVLKDSADYEELASNDLTDAIIATPAICDGCLIVRTRKHLYCFGVKS